MANACLSAAEMEPWLLVLRECYGENATIQNLQEMEPRFVLNIYLQFLQSTLCASLENMKMIGINSPEQMRLYPEAYEKCILLPRVAKLLRWFFNTMYGDDSFSFKDLISPTVERSQYFFSHMMNFIWNYVAVMERVEEIKQQASEKMEQLEEIEVMKKSSASRLQLLMEQQAQIEIQQEEELKESKVLSDEMNSIQVENARRKQRLDAIRETNEELKKAFNALNTQLAEMDEKCKGLQSEVVESEEVAQMQQTQLRLESINSENTDKKKQLSVLDKLCGEVQHMSCAISSTITPCVEDISSHTKQMSALEDELKQMQFEQQNFVSQVEGLDHKLNVLKQKETLLEEKRGHLKEQFKKKRSGFNADIESLEKILESVQQSDSSLTTERKDLNEDIENHKQLIQDFAEKLSRFVTVYKDIYERITAAMEEHNQRTDKGFQMLHEKLTNVQI